jgi:hypothetical protein
MTVMMAPTAEQEHAHDIDDQSEHRDRDRLVEVDRDRSNEAGHGFVADEERDHRENDSAGKSGQVPELAGAEAETIIVGVPACVTIGKSGEQQRARMRRHVQAVGNQRDRAKQPAADDLSDHHDAAQRNHEPSAAFVRVVARAEENVRMARRVEIEWGN